MKNRACLVVCIAVSFLGLGVPRSATGQDKASAKAESQRFTPEHLDNIVGVSDPQLSPDGKSIVFIVSRVNTEKNKYDRELVLLDLATKSQRPLTFERDGIGQPRWSPAGDRLAFLARTGVLARYQIHVMPMNGGDAWRLTNAPLGVQHYSWSPDGKTIAYAAADEAPKRDKNDDAFEIGNDGYLLTKAPTSAHIWLVNAGGHSRGYTWRLTSGTWSLPISNPPGSPSSALSWSPDGKSIAFVRQATPHYGDADQAMIQVISIDDGDSARSLTPKTHFESHPLFAPDGSRLIYSYPRDGDPNNVNEIHLVPFQGGEGKSLTRSLDRNISFATWLPHGKSLLVGGHDGTRVALWHLALEGASTKLDLKDVNPSWSYAIDAAVSKSGAVAFSGSEQRRPAELYYLPSLTETPIRLTQFNDAIAKLDLGRVETITWDFEGFHEDGVLVYPPDFTPGKKYPLVLYIHGGPTSTSSEAFSTFTQLMAARGYVVFSPNYRGSDNLGNAYQRAIFNDAGAGPGRDVMAGLEAVKKRGFVDEERIAVTGWSYGGYMTVWLTSHYHCWKTAIAGAAAIDRYDQYHLADYNARSRYRFGGSPWTGDFMKAYREQSPLSHAAKIKTPTLILALTGDARVPITQSFGLYHALRDNGVPVRFFAYPAPGHSPADPYRKKDVMKRWLAWLDEYLR